MFDTALIAAAHGIEAAVLDASLTSAGWDFSSLREDEPEQAEFVRGVVAGKAAEIAARNARNQARQAAQAAERLARMTPAARANPDLVCGKCDGKGKLDCFRHIAEGSCFWCKGAGVLRPRQKRAA